MSERPLREFCCDHCGQKILLANGSVPLPVGWTRCKVELTQAGRPPPPERTVDWCGDCTKQILGYFERGAKRGDEYQGGSDG